MRRGLWGEQSEQYDAPGKLQIVPLAEQRWISVTIDGDSPVGENDMTFFVRSQVMRVTWNPA